MPARQCLAAPVWRQFAIRLGTDAAQRLVEIALNLLQRGNAAGRGAMDALKTECETGVLQLEHVIVEQRVLLQARQLIEEAHAADAFAEEAAQHAVLRPDVAVFCRNILDDVVGGGADEVFGGICLSFGNAGRANVLLEELDGLGNLLHQGRERSACKRDAQAAEHQQQRTGRPQDRIFVGGNEVVDPQVGGVRCTLCCGASGAWVAIHSSGFWVAGRARRLIRRRLRRTGCGCPDSCGRTGV